MEVTLENIAITMCNNGKIEIIMEVKVNNQNSMEILKRRQNNLKSDHNSMKKIVLIM